MRCSSSRAWSVSGGGQGEHGVVGSTATRARQRAGGATAVPGAKLMGGERAEEPEGSWAREQVHGERRPRHRRRGEHGAVPASVRIQRSKELLQNAP